MTEHLPGDSGARRRCLGVWLLKEVGEFVLILVELQLQYGGRARCCATCRSNHRLGFSGNHHSIFGTLANVLSGGGLNWSLDAIFSNNMAFP